MAQQTQELNAAVVQYIDDKLFDGLEKCFDDNASKIYNLVKNARAKKVIDFNIWNYRNSFLI